MRNANRGGLAVDHKRYRDTALRVQDIADDQALQFVCNDADVNAIKDHLGEKSWEFESFFVESIDGEYTRIFGMYGTVPYAYRTLTTLKG